MSGRAVLLPTRRTTRPAKSAEIEGMKALATINNLTNPLHRRKVESIRHIPDKVALWVPVAQVAPAGRAVVDVGAVDAGEYLPEIVVCAAGVDAIADRHPLTIGRPQGIVLHPAQVRGRTTSAKRGAIPTFRRKNVP